MDITDTMTLIANVSAVNFAHQPYPSPVRLFEIPANGPVLAIA